MASKRSAGKSGSAAASSGPGTGPVLNAVLLGVAVCYGILVLVQRGKLAWPPNQLLASLYTVAGCLAIVGPIVLARSGAGEGGLGELLWMTGGLLIWVFDGFAIVHGDWRSTSWTTPIGYQTMGLTMLAVLLGGWRCRISGHGWSWTNVTGWILGLFWVAMALVSMLPARAFGVALN